MPLFSSNKTHSPNSTYKSNYCQREACAIQICLESRQYDQSKCESVIQKLFYCCNKLTVEEAESTPHCSSKRDNQ
ncbi:Cmc4p [Oopsacas minuta]|uniref:Cmc4p n=1 Tax=Oopsacas minuta TaxID=111878 RepID=A0AAV7JVD8_9METZ|nr:Cmc4p [Oopsacas minuta]